jgi:competence transcription factor ComK
MSHSFRLNSFTPSASRTIYLPACLPESRQLIAHFRQMFLFNKKEAFRQWRRRRLYQTPTRTDIKDEIHNERSECICSEKQAWSKSTGDNGDDSLQLIKMQNSNRVELRAVGNTMENQVQLRNWNTKLKKRKDTKTRTRKHTTVLN